MTLRTAFQTIHRAMARNPAGRPARFLLRDHRDWVLPLSTKHDGIAVGAWS